MFVHTYQECPNEYHCGIDSRNRSSGVKAYEGSLKALLRLYSGSGEWRCYDMLEVVQGTYQSASGMTCFELVKKKRYISEWQLSDFVRRELKETSQNPGL
jgi:hypothetical protein